MGLVITTQQRQKKRNMKIETFSRLCKKVIGKDKDNFSKKYFIKK